MIFTFDFDMCPKHIDLKITRPFVIAVANCWDCTFIGVGRID